jgi:16S rRNA (cytidine1402-2'-O)-methyltransferase
MSGILSVVGTPIGNLEDLSPRAARTLAEADVIACEDTRVTRKLLSRLPAPPRARLMATHARNEDVRAVAIVRAIRDGKRVALVTDAGMPGTSDPGRHVVAACIEAGCPIEIVPGPSAVPAALIASGLPAARFVFEGFLPRTNTPRARRLAALASEERTIVLFESPRRTAATLAQLASALGDRQAAVVRELTKIHEETLRGSLTDLAERTAGAEVRGEVTIVIEGAPPVQTSGDESDLAGEVAERIARGATKKDAISAVAGARGVPKRAVYQAVLDQRGR